VCFHHRTHTDMASEKTQASFDAVTSKLSNLTAKDDASPPKATDAAKKESNVEAEKASKPAEKLEEPGM
jgi:hypothetical protein